MQTVSQILLRKNENQEITEVRTKSPKILITPKEHLEMCVDMAGRALWVVAGIRFEEYK